MVTADWRSQTLGTSPLSLLTIQYCPSSWRTQDMRTGSRSRELSYCVASDSLNSYSVGKLPGCGLWLVPGPTRIRSSSGNNLGGILLEIHLS